MAHGREIVPLSAFVSKLTSEEDTFSLIFLFFWFFARYRIVAFDKVLVW